MFVSPKREGDVKILAQNSEDPDPEVLVFIYSPFSEHAAKSAGALPSLQRFLAGSSSSSWADSVSSCWSRVSPTQIRP